MQAVHVILFCFGDKKVGVSNINVTLVVFRCVFKQLTFLNLSGNTALSNDGFLNVLKGLGTILQELDVSACGLSSPLSETILTEIKLLFQNEETLKLQKINLSHNLLDLNDKTKLVDGWNLLCKEGSTVSVNEQMCILCGVVT